MIDPGWQSFLAHRILFGDLSETGSKDSDSRPPSSLELAADEADELRDALLSLLWPAAFLLGLVVYLALASGLGR